MVAFNEVGQGYFTFEDLDIIGAIEDIEKEIHFCKVEAFHFERDFQNYGYTPDKSDLGYYADCLTRPIKLLGVIDLLRRFL